MAPSYYLRLNFLSNLLFAFLFMTSFLYAAPIETVTNTNDMGAGSLRQAIMDVDPGGEIVFNLPGAGPHTIIITTTLDIEKSLTNKGTGRNLLIINGAGGAFRGIQVADGLDTSSRVFISGLTVDGGITGFGGILNSEDLTLNNIDVTGYGNAVVNFGASSEDGDLSVLNLNNCLISGNDNIGLFSLPGQTQLSAGGIVTVNQTTISDNGGPGIVNFGPTVESAMGPKVVVNKSTISGNAQGIVNEGANALGAVGGVLEVYNSTISNNRGDGIQTNGGSDSGTGAVTRVSSSTITGNAFIGLINFGSGPLTEVKNSIVAENTINNCGALDGVLTSLGVNISTDDTCPNFNQVTSVELNLGPLQNNGGPTETQALSIRSAALDIVTNCTFINGEPVLNDQRGFMRPPTNCDAGAFELGATPTGTQLVPTLSKWGMIITTILFGLLTLLYLRRTKIV